MKELTEERYQELTSHSQMLGIIGSYVEDFCNEDDTVLVGVLRLLGEYHMMRSDEMYDKIETLNNERQRTKKSHE